MNILIKKIICSCCLKSYILQCTLRRKIGLYKSLYNLLYKCSFPRRMFIRNCVRYTLIVGFKIHITAALTLRKALETGHVPIYILFSLQRLDRSPPNVVTDLPIKIWRSEFNCPSVQDIVI